MSLLQLNADIYENDPELERIRKERGYSYTDIITIHKDKLPNYEDKVILAEAQAPHLLSKIWQTQETPQLTHNKLSTLLTGVLRNLTNFLVV